MELLREEMSLGQLADKRKKDRQASKYEEITKDLYAQIGELSTKLSWLKKNLALTFGREQRLEMLDLCGEMSVTQQCELLSLNRTGLYYKPGPYARLRL